MVLEETSSQENSVNARVLQCSILGHTHFILYINDFPNDLGYTTVDSSDATLEM